MLVLLISATYVTAAVLFCRFLKLNTDFKDMREYLSAASGAEDQKLKDTVY